MRYGPGSAMMGSRRCEYCYCISGARKCIRPKCLLPLPGCTPLYAPHSCCPVAYNCTRECSLHSPRIQIITHTAFSSSLFFKISIRRRWRRSRETVSETLHLFPPFFFLLFFAWKKQSQEAVRSNLRGFESNCNYELFIESNGVCNYHLHPYNFRKILAPEVSASRSFKS